MCPNCIGFGERIRINTPYEYFDIIKQIKEVIAQGTIKLVDGTCPLDEISPNKLWTEDRITHIFQCTACDQSFQLSVDTYHGSGGAWEVKNN